MRRVAIIIALVSLVAAPLAAQGRGRNGTRGIPPGQLPPPGQCRVWYEGRPPGQQPRPQNCNDAERIASRDRNARVVYGDDARGRRNDDWRTGGDRRDDGRATPRRYPYPNETPYPAGRNSGYQRVAFDNGYEDGYEKGREDARDNDGYDPVRHSRYRSGDEGYEDRYGSKEAYRNVYRDGFRSGYDAGYRDVNYARNDRDGGFSVPWPF